MSSLDHPPSPLRYTLGFLVMLAGVVRVVERMDVAWKHLSAYVHCTAWPDLPRQSCCWIADRAARIFCSAAETLACWRQDAEACMRRHRRSARLSTAGAWHHAVCTIITQAVVQPQLPGRWHWRCICVQLEIIVRSMSVVSACNLLHRIVMPNKVEDVNICICYTSLPDLPLALRKPLCSCCDMAVSAASGIPCAA